MKRLGLICGVLLALLLASCSSADAADSRPDGGGADGSGPDVGGADGTADDGSPDDLAFDLDDEQGTVEPLDELRIALVKPDRLLPSTIALGDQASVIVADLLYDGLTEIAFGTDAFSDGPDGADEPTLVPALALGWSANDELTEWTFVLDVDRIDAELVAAHFAVLRQEARGSVAAAVAHVESVQAIGAGEVRFVLSEPDGAFPWLLSGVAFSVVGEQGATTGRHLLSADDEAQMHLVSQVDGLPDVTLVWEESARAAYNRLTVGVVDAAVAPPDAMEDARTRFGIDAVATGVTRFYGLNGDSPRLSDERLRQAVLLAVDRDRLVDEVLAVPAFSIDGLLSPALAGYDASGCGLACRHDPDASAELLEAALADGLEIGEIRIAVREGDAAVASAIARDLIAVGFESVVDEYPTEELAAVIAEGGAELFAFGYVAVAGSIDSVIPAAFASDSPANVARIQSPDVDALLETASSTADDAARWALLNEAHEAALAEGMVFPLAVAQSSFVAAPQAAGIVVRADGSLDIEVAE